MQWRRLGRGEGDGIYGAEMNITHRERKVLLLAPQLLSLAGPKRRVLAVSDSGFPPQDLPIPLVSLRGTQAPRVG